LRFFIYGILSLRKENDNLTLKGKKVKIIIENYEKNRKQYNAYFLNYIKENQHRIFTAKQEKKYKGTSFYTFKEDDTFVFPEANLQKV